MTSQFSPGDLIRPKSQEFGFGKDRLKRSANVFKFVMDSGFDTIALTFDNSMI